MSLLQLLRTGKGPMDGWIARAYGAPAEERMLLDGVFWLFEVRKS